VGRGHPEFNIDYAERIARETPNAFFINQFGNPDNAAAHESITGPEIFEQMGGDMDAIVFGMGSSGTMTGLGHYFARVAPHVDLVLADPQGSILTKYVNEGVRPDTVGSWTVEGIGSGFIPDLADFSNTRIAYQIPDRDSYLAARELLVKEGVLGGSSSGTIIAAALRYCRDQTTPKRVVAFVCDTGNKYLSKMFNDYWMLDNGYLERPIHGDLRDLIVRPYADRDTVVVAPVDLLTVAYQRMKLYDVSQLPVLSGDRVVGMLDESDLILAALNDESKLRGKVESVMSTRLKTVDVKTPLEQVMPLLDAGYVPIVVDGDAFVGLLTRMDVLNHLRRRLLR
jgi:cystathionine beta-synthase